MHVELPKAKKFREFGGEYVMIVISIITALGLEHAVQTYHQRHLAQEASERIEAELRADQKSIDTVLEHNVAMQERLEKLRAGLLDDIRRGTPEKEAIAHVLAKDKEALNLSIHSPTLRHEAWDVAVANQAASFIELERLQRYAALYAHVREIEAISNGSSNNFVNGPEMMAVLSDLQLGQAHARDLVRLMLQMSVTYGGIDGNLVNLRDDIAEGFAPKTITTAQR